MNDSDSLIKPTPYPRKRRKNSNNLNISAKSTTALSDIMKSKNEENIDQPVFLTIYRRYRKDHSNTASQISLSHLNNTNTADYKNQDHCNHKKETSNGNYSTVSCNVTIKKLSTNGKDNVDYHSDVDGVDTVPSECFYETSDTGGDQTTDIDIDSSTNLMCSLSFNSSNSNTSINNQNNSYNNYNEKQKNSFFTSAFNWNNARNGNAEITKIVSSDDGLDIKKKEQKLPYNILSSFPLRIPSSCGGSNGGGVTSSANSISDLSSAHTSPIARSKSFQEPGVKSVFQSNGRDKKPTKIFTRKRSKRSKNIIKTACTKNTNGTVSNSCKNSLNLVAISRKIEITIQDEDGNYQPYDDNFCPINFPHHIEKDIDSYIDDEVDEDDDDEDQDHLQLSSSQLNSGCTSDVSDESFNGGSENESKKRTRSKLNNSHLIGRLLKKVRRFSLNWRKPRYKTRRGEKN